MSIQTQDTPKGYEILADFYAARASAEPSQAAKNAREIFNAASEQERLRMLTHKGDSMEQKLRSMDFQIELDDSRRSTLLRNGKPA